MESIQNKLGFDIMEIWEANGWKCGIAILWNDSMGWEVIYKSKWIMGIQILIIERGKWTLWGCYGPADREERWEFWNTLCSLIKAGSCNWACMGNFNEVRIQSEKSGGREVSRKNNFWLNVFMDEIHGIDIGLNGNPFT